MIVNNYKKQCALGGTRQMTIKNFATTLPLGQQGICSRTQMRISKKSFN